MVTFLFHLEQSQFENKEDDNSDHKACGNLLTLDLSWTGSDSIAAWRKCYRIINLHIQGLANL